MNRALDIEGLTKIVAASTPGPWFVVPAVYDEWTIQDRQHGVGAPIARSYAMASLETDRANAQLIAFAPDMASAIDTLQTEITELRRQVEVARAALEPFANFADPRCAAPGNLPITAGSRFAKRQLTMDDCYEAAAALTLLNASNNQALSELTK